MIDFKRSFKNAAPVMAGFIGGWMVAHPGVWWYVPGFLIYFAAVALNGNLERSE